MRRANGAGPLKDLLARHDDLDRTATFLGEHRYDRIEVGDGLSPKPATNFHGDDFDLGFGYAENGGRGRPNRKGALGTRPDGVSQVLVLPCVRGRNDESPLPPLIRPGKADPTRYQHL